MRQRQIIPPLLLVLLATGGCGASGRVAQATPSAHLPSVQATLPGSGATFMLSSSRGAGTHEYTITLYALSGVPPSLPDHSSLDVTYQVLTAAISTVDVLGAATLVFTDTTP